MKRNWMIGLQIALISLQSMNVTLPSKAQVYVSAAIASIQGALAVLAHSFNPDGSAAAAPYEAPKKD